MHRRLAASGPCAIASPLQLRGTWARRTSPKIRRDRHLHLPDDDAVDVDEAAPPAARPPAGRPCVLPAAGKAHQDDVPRHAPPPLAPARQRSRGRDDSRRSCAASRPANRRRTSPASHRPAPAPPAPRRSRPSPAPRSRRSARSARWPSPPVVRSTVLSGDMSVEIGFMATRTTSGSPVVMPPSSPPALLLRRRKPPGRGDRARRRRPAAIGSCTCGAGTPRRLEAEPDLDPLHRGNRHEHRRRAGRRASGPSGRGCRVRRDSPRATTSISPPRVSPAFFAGVDPRDDRRLRPSRSSTRTGDRSAASLSGTGRSDAGGGADPAQRHDVAPDLDAELLEQPPGERARGDPRGGLPRAGALQDVARVEPVVLEDARPGRRGPGAGGSPGGGGSRRASPRRP